MYFLDRFNAESLLSLDFDNLDMNLSYMAMDVAIAAPRYISLPIAPDDSVNAPTPPGPLFANIDGTPGNDNPLNGTNDADVINGLEGDDVINGLDGDDVIDGGGGALAGTSAVTGNDIINGGAGNDTIIYSRSSTGSTDVDTNDGGTGIDTFIISEDLSGRFINLATGLWGNGTLASPGSTRGTLVNIENVSVFSNTEVQGDANDNVIIGEGAFDNLFNGGGGNDTINGGDGQDIIDGGSGNDTFINDDAYPGSGAQDDSYNGGTGIDTIDLSQGSGTLSDTVTVNLATGFITNFGSNRDSLTSIENVIVSGNGNIVGDANANVLTALGTGDNTISGGAGNDIIDAGNAGGTDNVDGGDGNDRFIFSNGSGTQYIGNWNGGAGTDIIQITGIGTFNLRGPSLPEIDFTSIEEIEFIANGSFGERLLLLSSDEISASEISSTALIDGNNSGGVDTIRITMDTPTLDISGWTFVDWNDVENEVIEIIGDASFETITGSIQDDVINSNGGNDVINAGTGNDIVNAGDGDDEIIDTEGTGATSTDAYDGGSGIDVLRAEVNWGTNILFNLATGQQTNDLGTVVYDSYTNIENLSLGGAADAIGDDGNNVITILDTGPTGSNFVDGGAGDDTISTNDDDDIVIGGAGADTLDGGADIDMLDYTTSDAAVTIDLAANTASGGHATGDVISNFENLDGSAFGDTLEGNADTGLINGNDGDDTIFINSGSSAFNAMANGGNGNDIIYGTNSALTGLGSYFATLNGDAGNDQLFLGGDMLLGHIGNGGSGDDTISIIPSSGWTATYGFNGGAGIDTMDVSSLASGLEINLASGGANFNGQLGDPLADLSEATISGIENVVGTQGSDLITGDANSNEILGGSGDDVINGGDGDDVLDGGAGTDSLNGEGGNDRIIFSNPISISESGDGGAGIDTLEISGFNFIGSPNIFDMVAGTWSINSFVLTAANFENFDGTTSLSNFTVIGTAGANTMIGGDGNDVFNGNDGIDTLSGGGGDDLLQGGAGADVMDGGAGFDTLEYAGSNAGVTVNLGTGLGSGGHAAGDSWANVEGIAGSGFNDILTGDANNNFLFGNNGNDQLDGGDGDDDMFGGDGADTFFGGAGADAMDGEAGLDIVDYSGASSRVVFNAGTGGTLGDALGDTYTSIERFRGSDFNDSMTGTAGNEFFFGGDGNDVINGGDGIDRIYGEGGNDIQRGDAGNDQLYGSAGSDQLNGGVGFDIANYRAATTFVSLNLGSGGTFGDAAGDTYFGIEAVYGSDFNDILAGNNSANELRGWDGNDTLNGAGGSDRLFGGGGADALNGGTGVDIAVYTDAASGVTLNLVTVGTVGDAAGDTFSSIEWVWGSDFNDIITGDAAGNRLEGRDGNDTLNGGDGNDRLLGGEGDDTINGGNGVDTIFGQNGNDNLIGAGGNDFFFGSDGGDTINGGLDFDTMSYLASTSAVGVDLQTSGFFGDANGDTYASIERVFGSQFDDYIIGSNGANTLQGNGGNDYLEGGLGNDSLFGGAGTDSYGYDTTNGDADVINGFSTAGELIYILGGDPAFDTWAEVQAVGTDAGANVIFDFGGGNTLTVVGQNLADLDAGDFDFTGPPPAAEILDDPGAYASEPLSFDEIMAIHQEFAAEFGAAPFHDALI